jgi:large subunit ribosomal protein L15
MYIIIHNRTLCIKQSAVHIEKGCIDKNDSWRSQFSLSKIFYLCTFFSNHIQEMDLHNLKPAKGSVHKEKRIGRGTGSGRGGTSTRGHKGAQSRSGYSYKIGFEGGQMPLQRRVPKFGFKNPNRIEFKAINLYTIETLANQLNTHTIGIDDLICAGLVSPNDLVKVLGQGTLTKALEITADAFSKSAVAAIEAQQGKALLMMDLMIDQATAQSPQPEAEPQPTADADTNQ